MTRCLYRCGWFPSEDRTLTKHRRIPVQAMQDYRCRRLVAVAAVAAVAAAVAAVVVAAVAVVVAAVVAAAVAVVVAAVVAASAVLQAVSGVQLPLSAGSPDAS